MATSPPTPPWCWPSPRGFRRARLPSASCRCSASDPYIDKVEIAGPGFINLTLSLRFWPTVLRMVLEQGDGYGKSAIGKGQVVNVEYVSANPTGPMHVGHCRGAVFGDALASLLAFTGFDVTREYYVNDAGAQVDALARSAYLRYREALGEDIGEIPEGLYPGDYLKPVGKPCSSSSTAASCSRCPRASGCRIVRDAALRAMLAMIEGDLAELGIHHDVFFSERSLIDGPRDRGRRDHRRPRIARASSTKAGCRRRRARSMRSGRTASSSCSAPPSSATTWTGLW